jgi:ECF sigma factor
MDNALGHEITQLLQAWRQGDERALDKLTPQIYRELHLAARRCMGRERDGHTLQTTALINEPNFPHQGFEPKWVIGCASTRARRGHDSAF